MRIWIAGTRGEKKLVEGREEQVEGRGRKRVIAGVRTDEAWGGLRAAREGSQGERCLEAGWGREGARMWAVVRER